MWIFRIIYLEKKEEEYDSLEIVTIRMFLCMGIYWSWNTWHLNLLIIQMGDMFWKKLNMMVSKMTFLNMEHFLVWKTSKASGYINFGWNVWLRE